MTKKYLRALKIIFRPWLVSLVYGAKLSETVTGFDLINLNRRRRFLFVLIMAITAVIILPAVTLSMAGDKKYSKKSSAENFE